VREPKDADSRLRWKWSPRDGVRGDVSVKPRRLREVDKKMADIESFVFRDNWGCDCGDGEGDGDEDDDKNVVIRLCRLLWPLRSCKDSSFSCCFSGGFVAAKNAVLIHHASLDGMERRRVIVTMTRKLDVVPNFCMLFLS